MFEIKEVNIRGEATVHAVNEERIKLEKEEQQKELNEFYVREYVPLLKEKLEISKEQPINEDGTPKIITSVDVKNGHPDSWFRKGNFTSALGYMRVLEASITDVTIVRRIEDMLDYCYSDKFSDRKPTTHDDVSRVVELTQDVVNYFENKSNS